MARNVRSMLKLAMVVTVLLAGCATAPRETQAWDWGDTAGQAPEAAMVADASRGVVTIPRYLMNASIVNPGGNYALVLNGYALCPFNVKNASGTVEGSVDCSGNYTATTSAVAPYFNATTSNGFALGGSTVLFDNGSTGVSLRGYTPNTAGGVGVVVDNQITLSTAGAKLLSVRNHGTEDAYFDKDGALFTGATAKPVPAVISASAAQAIQTGTGTCSTNSATVTFGTAFAATPVCTCSATTTAASACNANAPGTTGFTAKCAGASDTFGWQCIGNR